MGAPRRIRKKYEKPGMMWDKQRIEHDHKMQADYGLKNMRELWMTVSELRRIRQNVRNVLSGKASAEVGKEIIARLARYNIVSGNATLDDILVVNVEKLLDRRLQTVVFRKGMAKSLGQARQLIAHGFIAVGENRVTSPGYLVSGSDEPAIRYYKPFKIEMQLKTTSPAPQAAPPAPAAA